MEIGLVRRIDIDQEMQQSYLDYAMSVIVARALPDARDGLKPVQRRILYGMYELGLRAESAYKKSARIVGEVLGKFHPHGDQAVYDAMARLAQDFSMRYALVDGQGNFGSVDGDPPAAMRYTEARLASAAIEILSQLDRNTVNFVRNFDDTLNEPEVLPAAIPNLLVNGTSGIAVGMATSIPPHNLDEVISALRYMLDKWEKLEDVTVSDLMKYIKGPDFPTGGIILQENQGEDLLGAYATGRGKVTLRGKVHLEEMGRGKSRMIISELPYQTNKASLIERIAELARENALEGISDLRDESDRGGMRIVIEVNRVADVENVLRELYKRTPLQTTFRISLLALVNGEPHMLSLKQALRVYLEHRLSVVKRRSEFDLEKARQRAHILEGLRTALQHLDEVIKLIRAAQDVDEARLKLMRRFKLSEIQSNAILEMPLRRLAALERKKIELEYKEVIAQIKELEALLRSAKKMRQVVGDELQQIKEKYGDKRRTQIVSLREGKEKLELLTTADVTPEQTVWVGVTEDGIIGRTAEEKLSRVSGKLAPRWIIRSTTHHTLYMAATDGRCAAVAVQSLPIVENFEDGLGLHKVSPFEESQQVSQIFSLPPKSEIEGESFIVTVSRKGLIKKTAINELPGPSTQLFVLAKVNPGDELGWMFETDGRTDIVLVTSNGMAIRFSEDEVRPMGLIAAGVNGIKLIGEDQLCGALSFQAKAEMLLVCPNGRGWRIASSEFPKQGRYGQGIIVCRPEKYGGITGLLYGNVGTIGLLHLAQSTSKTVRVGQIPSGKRQSAAKEVLAVRQGDHVTGITFLEAGGANAVKKGSKPKPRGRKHIDLAEETRTVSSPPLPGLFGEKTARTRRSTKIESEVKPATTKRSTSRSSSAETKRSKVSPTPKKPRSTRATMEEKPALRGRKTTPKAETGTTVRRQKAATIKPAVSVGQPELTPSVPKPRRASAARTVKEQPASKKSATARAAPDIKRSSRTQSSAAAKKPSGAKAPPARSTPAKSTPAKSRPARGTNKPNSSARTRQSGITSGRTVKKPASKGK